MATLPALATLFTSLFVGQSAYAAASEQKPTATDATAVGESPDANSPAAQSPAAQSIASYEDYIELTSRSPATIEAALRKIEQGWHPGGIIMLVEASRFCHSDTGVRNIVKLLETKTGQKIGRNAGAWYRWIWSQKYQPHPQYAQFKSELYSPIDKRFTEYFLNTKDSLIRLDEIRWGGVKRDGIPPLKNPEMIAANKADYLADSDVVFGVEFNGDIRCYPKRILAWHEMFKDNIGDTSFCGAY